MDESDFDQMEWDHLSRIFNTEQCPYCGSHNLTMITDKYFCKNCNTKLTKL